MIKEEWEMRVSPYSYLWYIIELVSLVIQVDKLLIYISEIIIIGVVCSCIAFVLHNSVNTYLHQDRVYFTLLTLQVALSAIDWLFILIDYGIALKEVPLTPNPGAVSIVAHVDHGSNTK